MNIIEQRIWDYLDGTCSEQERESTELLIATDARYKKIFEELSELSVDLSGLNLEEPPMRFTANVMEQIKGDPVPGSIRSLIDKRIIYGLSIFFVFVIAASVIFVALGTDWTQSISGTSGFELSVINFSKFFDSKFLMAFLFLDIIALLYFADTFLRRKLHSQQE